MNRQKINALNRLLASLGIIALGIIMIFEARDIIPLLRILSLGALIFLFASRIFGIFLEFDAWKENLFYALLYALLVAVIINLPDFYTRFIAFIVGIYALANALIQFINYYIFRKNHVQGVLFALFRAILSLISFIVLMTAPFYASPFIFVISGIYLILFGIFNSLSWLNIIFHERFSLTLSLPAFITALLPPALYMRIKNNPDLKPYLKCLPISSKYPLQVSVHTHDGGFEAIGHIDVTLKGITYNYGLHDPKARRLFGSAGDGVLVVVNHEAFIKNSLKDHKTMIFDFQLDLDEKEINEIEKRIALLMQDAYPFSCAAKLEEEAGLTPKADDYISRVYRDTACKLYKFKSGPFKTYFVFSQNCIQLTDFLIRNQEIDLLKMSGVITPGAYLSFLFSLYEKNDSLVKDLIIYK